MRFEQLAVCLMVGSLGAGCAMESAPELPQTSETSGAITSQMLTEFWGPEKTDVNGIWPLNQGITSTYVMLKGAPPDVNGNGQFFGFVIWNNTTVGHVYRVRRGNDGGNFRATVNQAMMRTNNHFDWDAGTAGSVEIPPPPRPGPNGDGDFMIFPSELDNAKVNAHIIHDATRDFMEHSQLGS